MEKQVEVIAVNNELKLEITPIDNGKNQSKPVKVIKSILKVCALLICLYSFIISLDLMSSSFRLIGGKYASEAFKSSVITNPVAGLVIGVIVTVVVQSSSTSTSIVVSMVSSGIMEVKYAIPIIMGANIGTSVTSVLVSLTQVADKENFQRAFSGATVHDSFNLLSVLVLLPIEVLTGYLQYSTKALVGLLVSSSTNSKKEIELLTALTKPLTNSIIQLDKKVLEAIAQNTSNPEDTLIKHFCPINKTENSTLIHDELNRCSFLLEGLNWPEWAVGLLLLIVSLVVLCSCLIALVKILSSIFNGPMAKLIQKIVNADLPGKWKYFTSPIAILLGCLLTIIVQSSSVFTSSLIPLVGLGLVKIERLFPLTLGSNLGTTVTGILASLSASSRTLKYSLQIALCHTLFNITGILIWYPIPFMRKCPLAIARFLGRTSADYRWFGVFYIVLTFVFVPSFIFALSLSGLIVFLCVLIPIIILIAFVLIINYIQTTKFVLNLPKILRNWNFLPLPLRSLEPYDKIITRFCCSCLKNKSKVTPVEDFVLGEIVVSEPATKF